MILGLLLLISTSFAGDNDDNTREHNGRTVTYQSRTVIDFEGLEIAGQLVKPQGSLILDRRRANFNPLIQLRTDFNREMHQSVDEIK
tara:strand:+ start:3733 stop:3993 length:261 start_codon:yes stop_codon:yes gene_type:complete